MAIKIESITIDTLDPDTLGAWWAEATGGSVNPVVPGEFVLVARDGAPNIAFQHVEDPTPGKNKAHLDFSTDDVEGEVARLVGLGAKETGRHSFGEEFCWVVLSDPEGNAFCIAAGG